VPEITLGKPFSPCCLSEYYELAEKVDNLVPACADCNHLKHYYDPSEGKVRSLSPQTRFA